MLLSANVTESSRIGVNICMAKFKIIIPDPETRKSRSVEAKGKANLNISVEFITNNLGRCEKC